MVNKPACFSPIVSIRDSKIFTLRFPFIHTTVVRNSFHYWITTKSKQTNMLERRSRWCLTAVTQSSSGGTSWFTSSKASRKNSYKNMLQNNSYNNSNAAYLFIPKHQFYTQSSNLPKQYQQHQDSALPSNNNNCNQYYKIQQTYKPGPVPTCGKSVYFLSDYSWQ